MVQSIAGVLEQLDFALHRYAKDKLASLRSWDRMWGNTLTRMRYLMHRGRTSTRRSSSQRLRR